MYQTDGCSPNNNRSNIFNIPWFFCNSPPSTHHQKLSTALKAIISATLASYTLAPGVSTNTSGSDSAFVATALTTAATAAVSVSMATTCDGRKSVKDIENGFVLDGSKQTYHEKLILFTCYLLDNKPDYLADDHREELQAHDEADSEVNMTTTSKNTRSKVRA